MLTIPPLDLGRKPEVCPDARLDEREQLFNGREAGPVGRVSLPHELITRLHAVMFDVDLKWLAPELLSAPGDGPGADREPAVTLYGTHVRAWLDHDPVLKNAEVRFTGTGLHALLHIAPAIEFHHVGDRQRWAGMVRAVQCCLPTDPSAPVLTALTRPLGSTNSKSGKTVTRLCDGAPVTPEQVRELYERVSAKPFATVAKLLFGSERVSPCPVCHNPNCTLVAGPKSGSCYGGCGSVTLTQLMGSVMAAPKKEVTRGEG